MFISFKTLTLVAGVGAACAAAAPAEAQWFPPLGAAAPGEIVQRLNAQGYVLIGPLRRTQTVYLADVSAGPAGRERLVIDAWSGEILQRFVARPKGGPSNSGGYAVEGGEFSAPPPLGPPPMQEFYSGPGNYAYGAPNEAGIPPAVGPVNPLEAKPRPKPRPHKPAEAKPATSSPPSEQAAKPPDAGAAGSASNGPTPAAPAAAAPGAPAAATPAVAAPAAAAPAETQAKNAAAPQRAPAPQPAEKGASDKSKVNDVPVNPLE